MIACAAVLSCTSAVNLDTEITSEASKGQWDISDYAREYINQIDRHDWFGLKGAN